MYAAVNDYKDLRDDDDTSPEEVAAAKAHMLKSIGNEFGVKTLSSPWERLEQLAQERKDY
jgi:hypothetical protein